MSIPQRFYRIARYKLAELKEQFDKIDEESLEEQNQKLARGASRADARHELQDAFSTMPVEPTKGPALRSPDEIARGLRATSPTNIQAPAATTDVAPGPDPLTYHYRQLGVPAGADFVSVQAAYTRLAARCDASRFPEGSDDARLALDIRSRLDTSFKLLRDALDPTARRFDMLELDAPNPN